MEGRQNCVKYISASSKSIMFCWAICCDGFKKLVKCPIPYNQKTYIRTLMNAGVMGKSLEGFTFQQDNASIHSAGNVQKWLGQNKINVLPWPPYSPDINIIENVWSVLKYCLRTMSVTPQNLEGKVFEAWEIISHSRIQTLYEYLLRRINRVIASKGQPIAY